MKMWTALGQAVAGCAVLVLCNAAAWAEPADSCATPGYLLPTDSQLERVETAVKKDRALKILVLGGTSSTLPGPNGASFAYPSRLDATLRSRLPGIKVAVAAHTKARQSAADMADMIDQLRVDEKPTLVVWQTGT